MAPLRKNKMFKQVIYWHLDTTNLHSKKKNLLHLIISSKVKNLSNSINNFRNNHLTIIFQNVKNSNFQDNNLIDNKLKRKNSKLCRETSLLIN